MKELPSAGAQEGSDVLEVWGGTRCSTKRRRIEQTAPRGEENEACDTGPDLEPSGVEVSVRNAVAREVQNGPEKECCEPRTCGGGGRSACRDVEGDDHRCLSSRSVRGRGALHGARPPCNGRDTRNVATVNDKALTPSYSRRTIRPRKEGEPR
jgi:hypothetical protein